MFYVRALEDCSEPRTLGWCIRGKVEYDGNAFKKKRAQMSGPSASLNREERFTYPGMSVISPGKRQFNNSSSARRTAFSRAANSLARVDFPAAILPQKNINFAEVLME